MSEKETGAAYSAYVLGLADDALIYSHPVSYTHLTLPTIYSV